MNSLTPMQVVLPLLRGVTRSGGGYKALCPAHLDDKHSLTLTEGNDTRVLVKCHAGCTFAQIAAAMNLQPGAFFPPKAQNGHGKMVAQIVATYNYHDEAGNVLFQAVRYIPKDFKQRHMGPDGRWVWNLNGVRRVLYRLPELLAADPGEWVYLCAGEKDANRLISEGMTATTNPMGEGADKWLPEYTETLRGRWVVILTDNDPTGRARSRKVSRALYGVAQVVKILELPELPEHGDVSDFLDQGHTMGDVREILSQTPIYHPPVEEPIHSAEYREGVSAETKVRLWSAREIASATTEVIDWLAEPWLVRSCITEVDGKIKQAGKTTWVTHMCRSVLDGRPFMGKPTAQTGIVYLTEQPKNSLRQALRRADLLERDDFKVVLWHETRGMVWADVVEDVGRQAAQLGIGLLVVDVLSRFAGISGDAENSSGPAQEAMEPLKVAAALYNLAVVIVRHERKSGGEVGDSGRGSSAYSGDADIVLSIRKPEGNAPANVRVIHAIGRFDETPERLMIQLTEQGYVSLGSESEYAVKAAKLALLANLPTTEEAAQTQEELQTPLKLTRTTMQTALAELLEEGLARKVGGGKKNDPFKYFST